MPKRSRRHNVYCSCTTKILSKGAQVIEESQYVENLLKESNFAYVNKSEIDHTLLISHIALKPFEVCQSSVNRIIVKMKKKY